MQLLHISVPWSMVVHVYQEYISVRELWNMLQIIFQLESSVLKLGLVHPWD